MATVSVLLKEQKATRDGTAPLYLRVTHGRGQSRLVSLGLRLKPAQWNADRQRARSNAPGAERINEAIARAVLAGQQAVADAAAGGIVSAEDIRGRIEARLHPDRFTPEATAGPAVQTGPACILAYGEAATVRLENEGRIATARAYRTALHKAAEFAGRKAGTLKVTTLPFEAVTTEFVERLRAWQASPPPHGVGLATNTVHKNVTSLARLWRLAEREGVLDRDGRPPADPFRRVVVKRAPTRRDTLTSEEVRAIEEVLLTDHTLAETRGLWVLALYAGGMRFSDVATLRRGNVTRSPDGEFRIAYRMKKTKGLPSLPVTGAGAEVLATHWDQRGLETAGPDALVFPLLDGYDLSDPKKAFGAVSSQNAMTNERLKAVQKQAEAHLGRAFPAALTFHLARHSLALRLLEAGWDVYDMRVVLAHGSVRMTEEYIKGFGRPDLDEKLRKLF